MLTVDCKMGCIRHLRWCFGIRPRRGQIDESRVRALRHGGVWCWTGNYMLTELQDECAKAEETGDEEPWAAGAAPSVPRTLRWLRGRVDNGAIVVD